MSAADRAARKAEARASAARIEAAQAEARAAWAANRCPKCGRKVGLNLSIAGWVQCEQYGAPMFRADPSAPACSWQGFTR